MFARYGIAFVSFIALTAFTSAAPVPRYKSPKVIPVSEQLKKLQGLWDVSNNATTEVQVRAAVAGAQVAPARRLLLTRSSLRVRIEGDRWTYLQTVNGEERPTTSYRIKLDTSTTPISLDLIRESTNSSMYLQGILSFEGDTVKFCYVSTSGDRSTKARPKDFTTENRQLMRTLKRVATP